MISKCLLCRLSSLLSDERDKTEWDEGHPDFRTLPSMSSNLRRPYRRYRIRKKLGQGKFSDVYEALDLRFCRGRSIVSRSRRRGGRRRHVSGFVSDDGETTGDEGDETDPETETDNDESISEDPSETSLVVLKCLKPVSERKIRRELLVLTHCRHLPNLVRLVGIVLPLEETGEHDSIENDEDAGEKFMKSERKIRLKENIGSITDVATDVATARGKQGRESDGRSPALVLGHAGKDAQWLCQNPKPPPGSGKVEKKQLLDEDEIAYFLLHLLVALDGLHEAGIIHRDVKPRNTLINRSTFRSSFDLEHVRPLVLVDLGLADFYLPGAKLNCRVASRHYKSPELLIGFKQYDYAIDLWSVGCILAGMLFRKEPFFKGATNEDQVGDSVCLCCLISFFLSRRLPARENSRRAWHE